MSNTVSSALRQFNYMVGEANAAYHSASVRLGLSDSAMHALYVLYENDGECMLSDIIKLTDMSKQTLNSAIRRMEADGIVECRSVGRRQRVSLTEHGFALADRTVRRIIEIENAIFAEWTQEELDTYMNLNKRYTSALKAKVEAMQEVEGE